MFYFLMFYFLIGIAVTMAGIKFLIMTDFPGWDVDRNWTQDDLTSAGFWCLVTMVFWPLLVVMIIVASACYWTCKFAGYWFLYIIKGARKDDEDLA